MTSLRHRMLCTSRSNYDQGRSHVMVPRTAVCTSRTRLSDAGAHASNHNNLPHNTSSQNCQIKTQTMIHGNSLHGNDSAESSSTIIQNADWIKQCGANLEIRPSFLQQHQTARGSSTLENQTQLQSIPTGDVWRNKTRVISDEDSLKSLPGNLTLI